MAARAKIAGEPQKARDKLAYLKVSLKAASGERECLYQEVTALKKERDAAKMVVIKSEIDHECNDEYIDHLALYWNIISLLSLL